MTVTRIDRLEAFWTRYADAEAALLAWLAAVQGAQWKKPTEIRQTWRSSDAAVPVASGRKAAVLNIRGNKYRLIATIDYRLGIVNVAAVLTHAEYDRDKWKKSL
jgi:mRNA interferase HigB